MTDGNGKTRAHVARRCADDVHVDLVKSPRRCSRDVKVLSHGQHHTKILSTNAEQQHEQQHEQQQQRVKPFLSCRSKQRLGH